MTAVRPGPASRLSVLAVDDDTVIRTGLPVLIPELDFVRVYADAEALLAERLPAQVVLLDLHLHGTGAAGLVQGAQAVRSVVEAGYRVCVYTNERRRHVLVGCLAAGAHGIVHKAEPLSAVSQALAAVVAGEVVITQALVGLAELAERRHALPTLTERQRQVLSARARGESFRSIGDRFFISKKVAEEHMAVVSNKFAEYLRDHSPADLERLLGLESGDLIEWSLLAEP